MVKQIHLVDYFDSALAAFEQSEWRNDDSREVFIRLAERFIVRLRFSRAALVPSFIPALEHLIVPEVEQPDFTLCIWDRRPSLPIPHGKVKVSFNTSIY